MHLHIHQPYRGGKELGRERRNEWSIEKASRRTQIKRSIYFLQQKLKKGLCTIPHPHPFSQQLLMGRCLPLCFSALCSWAPHTRGSCALTSALALIHTQMCARAHRKFPPSLSQLLHYTLSYLFDHTCHMVNLGSAWYN